MGAYSGVQVNPLATGYVRGHDAENSMNDHDGPRRRTVEIAAAIVYLASPASTYVTVAILSIEGGYTA